MTKYKIIEPASYIQNHKTGRLKRYRFLRSQSLWNRKKWSYFLTLSFIMLTLYVPAPQNGQAHSNLSAFDHFAKLALKVLNSCILSISHSYRNSSTDSYWFLWECSVILKLHSPFLKPFHTTDLFWYPLKTSENLWFSDVFRGYQKRSVAWNGLTVSWMVLAKLKLNFFLNSPK